MRTENSDIYFALKVFTTTGKNHFRFLLSRQYFIRQKFIGLLCLRIEKNYMEFLLFILSRIFLLVLCVLYLNICEIKLKFKLTFYRIKKMKNVVFDFVA